MRFQKWLYPGLLCLTVSCIGPATRPQASRVPVPPEHVVARNYEANVRRTATPGQVMVKVQDYWLQSHPASSIILDRAVTLQTRKQAFTLPHGAMLLNSGSIVIQGKPYSMYHNASDDSDYGIIYYFNPDQTFAGFLYLKDGRTFPSGMQTITKVSPASFRLPPPPAPTVLRDREQLDYEMVFQGLGADGIKVSYREFPPAGTSPSYQEELTFPAEAQQISYKNIQIQVNRCSEGQLEFTVVSD